MIQEAIVKIVSKQDLTYDEAYAVMNEIMSGETTATQNAAFLAALSTKSTRAETIDEISGCAAAMRAHATPVETGMDTLEIVGTGGDHSNTCVRLLNDVGACFLFAQKYHSSMKYVGSIRKELGIRTVFNILGPITNPAKPKMELLGVYDPLLVEPLARVLTSLGTTRGMVVHGWDGLDEISASAPTEVCEFRDGEYKTYQIRPEDFGLPLGLKTEIVGGTPEENSKITLDILSGKEQGTKRNIVLMNAGAGLYIADKASTLSEGVRLAAELIDSGAALAKVEEFRKASNDCTRE